MKNPLQFQLVTAAALALVLAAAAQAQNFYHITDLGVLEGASECSAWDINNAGQVVGACRLQLNERAFLWSSSGGMQDLGVLPGHSASTAVGINDKSPSQRVHYAKKK